MQTTEMPNRASWREFLSALAGDWIRWMSGLLSIILTVASFFVLAPVMRAILIVEAILAAVIAAYRVWASERTERARLAAIVFDSRPKLVSYIVGQETFRELHVKNVGNGVATGVRFEALRAVHSSADFLEVQVIAPGEDAHVQAIIAGPARDLWEICDELAYRIDAGEACDPAYGAMLRSSSGFVYRNTAANERGRRPTRHAFDLKFSYFGSGDKSYEDGSQVLIFSFSPATLTAGAKHRPAAVPQVEEVHSNPSTPRSASRSTG